MNKIINYLKSISMFLIVFFVYLLLISIIGYFELFNYKTINIINYIVMIVLFFLGHKTAHMEQKKGYLNGFLVSLVLVIIFLVISLFTSKIGFPNIVYYMSLILSSVIGGIVGVKEKK